MRGQCSLPVSMPAARPAQGPPSNGFNGSLFPELLPEAAGAASPCLESSGGCSLAKNSFNYCAPTLEWRRGLGAAGVGALAGM